jgi:hypothetical protein
MLSRNGAWIPLPAILALHIAQDGARVHELRHLGYHIENRQEGERSWFRLVGFTTPVRKREPQSVQGELFDLTQEHRDLG